MWSKILDKLELCFKNFCREFYLAPNLCANIQDRIDFVGLKA